MYRHLHVYWTCFFHLKKNIISESRISKKNHIVSKKNSIISYRYVNFHIVDELTEYLRKELLIRTSLFVQPKLLVSSSVLTSWTSSNNSRPINFCISIGITRTLTFSKKITFEKYHIWNTNSFIHYSKVYKCICTSKRLANYRDVASHVWTSNLSEIYKVIKIWIIKKIIIIIIIIIKIQWKPN